MLESWLTLMQTCPRHFRLRVTALDSMTVYSIPTACKRMTERQLGQVWAGRSCLGAADARDVGEGLSFKEFGTSRGQ